MSELPASWAWSTIGDLAQYIQRGKSPRYADRSDLPVVNQKCIRWNRLDAQHLKFIHPDQIDAWDAARYIRAGDVLWNSTGTGTVGRAYLIQERDCTPAKVVDSHVTIVRPTSEIQPRYLFSWIRSPAVQNKILDMCDGTTNQIELSRAAIAETAMPVAPIAEQTRITDQLDTLLARIQACNDRLDAMPALLKRFRQAVLDAAMAGALTEASGSPTQDLSAEGVLAARLGAEVGAAKRKLQQFLLNHPPQPGGSALPPGWLRTHVGVVGTVTNGSTPSRGVAQYWNGDIPWVSSGEVANGMIRQTRESITTAGFQNSSVRLLPKGTVLIAMIGEGKTRGQSALLDIQACINQNVAGVIPVPELMESRYLWYWFQRQYETTRTKGNGSGPKALNCDRVRELEVFLPPLVEQVEIVRRVDALFKFADQIRASHAAAIAQAHRLMPLTLAKAFRGELVPQDPNDEPASDLLRRIAALRATSPVVPKLRPPPREIAPRAPKETAAMTKSRQDDDVMGHPYLADHLRRLGTPATAEALFQMSELPVADFYKQLAWEVAQGHVTDNKTTLEPGHAAG